MKSVRSCGTFQVLVGTHPFGSDPSRPPAQGVPLPVRHTVTYGPILDSAGVGVNGRMEVAATGIAGITGSFTVADNDFSTGRTELVLGIFRISDGIDYVAGANVGATATAIASAISKLPGLGASANGAVVTVVYGASAGYVDFRALHFGQIANFTGFSPSDGALGGGSPTVSAPLLG